MTDFTDDLVQRTIKYYAKKGEQISEETARDYLHSLAGLYEIMERWADPNIGTFQ
ncbi:MAG TPA: hypothetical protein VNF51_03100 [Candidatus Paceibacterota bacterium]|nr:hypothetical protein [Candidatus Paceibacterota bacterium]